MLSMWGGGADSLTIHETMQEEGEEDEEVLKRDKEKEKGRDGNMRWED